MRTVVLAERAAVLSCLVALAAPAARAEDALGPMAGTGGVLRDAERRALAPAVEPSAPGEAPAPPAEAAPVEADAKPAAPEKESAGSRVLGPVSAVAVSGSREFAAKERIAERIQAALGDGDKTVSDVTAALFAVKQEMIGLGYYLFRVSLPKSGAYDRESGTLAVVVDEGRFGKVNIAFDGGAEDGFWFSRSQMMRRFRDIDEGDTFDYGRLRGALFDANAHPDITIDTAIDVRKGMEGEGADRRLARYADMNLTVRESCPFHMVWEVNNYGMEEVEEWQTSLTAQYLNLTKHDDVLTISPSMSFGAELMSVAASYMLPHDWWRGGNTTLYGGYSLLDVDDVVPRLDLEGTGYFVGLQHSESIYDSDRHLLAVSAGLLWRYIEDQYTALGYQLNKRGASILPVSLALSYTGKKPDAFGGRNFATVQGVYNLVNGDDELSSMWTGAEEHYWLLRWQAARLQPVFGWFDPKTELDLHQWMLFMKLEGQYTSDTLIPVEKLSLGGYNCLRGYHARGYLGDWGVYGTFELRSPILVDAFASMFGDRTDKTPVDRLQFIGFFDWGWTAFNDLPAGYDDNEFICSAGFGMRMAMTKYTQFKCDVAFPLRDTDWADDESVEVYFSMQVQF